MSAEVLGCGHAAHLMDVHRVKAAPHIHVHNLTDEKEYEEQGFGITELCCHGCAESVTIRYDEKTRAIKFRDAFARKHTKCPAPMDSNDVCPNYRSKFTNLDIRKSAQVVKETTPNG